MAVATTKCVRALSTLACGKRPLRPPAERGPQHTCLWPSRNMLAQCPESRSTDTATVCHGDGFVRPRPSACQTAERVCLNAFGVCSRLLGALAQTVFCSRTEWFLCARTKFDCRNMQTAVRLQVIAFASQKHILGAPSCNQN